MNQQSPRSHGRAVRRLGSAALGLLLAGVALLCGLSTGCRTPEAAQLPLSEISAMQNVPDRINPGDVIQVTFPGGPAQVNTPPQRVRVDGKVALPLVGDVVAAGKTPAELQADISKLYEKELEMKDVVVVVSSSAASVFVSGAVGHPGRIAMERPLTLLDAIMEAGGFDPRRANMKKVTIIRQKNGRYEHQVVNLKPVLKGQNVPSFRLQPFDIIFVPEKIF